MKILYIANHLNTGGITSYLLTLIIGMRRRGHEVYLASSGGELLGRFLSEGINCIPIPIKTKSEISPRIWLSLSVLKDFIKTNKIDMIHAHSRTTQVLACLLRRKTKVPLVSTAHGFFKPRLSRRLFPCWGDRIIAISKEVKEHLIFHFHIPADIITVVHNGIDVDRFGKIDPKDKDEMRRSLGLSAGPVIGIIARLSDVKGHRYLIEAMPKVLKVFPQAQLLIVGEGKLKAQIVGLVRKSGIGGNVLFMPTVNDTASIWKAIDICAVPSLQEGLGLSLMEAMSSGLAVVGSDVGGIKSLIKHNVNGLLVKPADPNALAEALISLLKSDEKRKSLGDSARSTIATDFNQEKMIQQSEEVYIQCLNQKK